jgi:hypothetical protein
MLQFNYLLGLLGHVFMRKMRVEEALFFGMEWSKKEAQIDIKMGLKIHQGEAQSNILK